jgi:transposase InsO family protein
MTVYLRQAGWKVNAKRVARLMREMGLTRISHQTFVDYNYPQNLEAYFRFYNHERPHQSLDWRAPMAVYWDSRERWDGVSLAADAAGTPVGLRPPSVPAAGEDPLHINLEIPWS